MNDLMLFLLAIEGAKIYSLEEYPNETVYMFFNGESEYTVVSEDQIEDTIREEKALGYDLTLAGKFYNGKVA